MLLQTSFIRISHTHSCTLFCLYIVPPPAPGPALPAWSFGGCPPAFKLCVKSPCFYQSDEFKAFPYVEVDGEVWECISNSGRCGQAGYEPGKDYPGFGALYLEAWKPLMKSCSGPNPNPNLDAFQGESLPAWEKLGCPEGYDSEVTYEEGDNVVAFGNIVYECKGSPDTQFCSLISPEGSNGWPGSLGWTTVGSCDGTSELCEVPYKKVLCLVDDMCSNPLHVFSNISQ